MLCLLSRGLVLVSVLLLVLMLFLFKFDVPDPRLRHLAGPPLFLIKTHPRIPPGQGCTMHF